ncbi:putative FMN adenylyltransferase [Dioszegia hungarica]|uniref:FAD synthase n=1 Tax=Dioszegia hungarica TaxID=4972 RepID=A0AA38LS59_9TREE|nr:putative FMN adenylyltransferase [Dioszegia hungarica]KAI9633133.1 putative FMN adenylyltransferase [Dioszegia hungarica]
MPRIRPEDLVRVLQLAQEQTDAGRRIADAIALIEGVMDDLGEEAISISFNGGKDCTVLLHLYAAVLLARHTKSLSSLLPTPAHLPISSPTTNGLSEPKPILSSVTPSSPSGHITTPPSPPLPTIKAIYITAPDPFPLLDEFVLSSAELYGMDLYRFGGGMKAALGGYLGGEAGKGVKGMLMGTRKGDPNGDVEPLAPTDPSWPSVLRIHPILDWSYAHVWDFLRDLNVPYCSLYDEGYTSLGSTKNTVPNPLLRNPSAPSGWDPAWKLTDGSKERCGRLDSSS